MSVLVITFIILFATIGAFTGEFYGLLSGAVLGYCLAALLKLRKDFDQLTRQLEQLREYINIPQPDKTATTHSPVTHKKAEDENAGREQAKPEAGNQTETSTAEPALTQAREQAATTSKPEPVVKRHKPATTASEPAVSSTPSTATTPRKSNPVDILTAYVRKFFTDGNVVVKVGMLFLIIGVGFLLKYAYDEEILTVSMPMRFIGSALLGLVLVILGWRFRHAKQLYALILQGGGIGVMYLTVFGAAKFFSMVPIALALAMMIGLVIFSALLAVLQNAKSLAFFAAAGGFLAPVLLSTGSGNHVVLFSYYTLLNIGILSIAWKKSWRELNLLGFVFTFVIGGLWGFGRYSAENFYTTEPFLIIFFLMYVTISVLYAYRQPPKLKGYIDGTLVFGVPIISFTYQAAIVETTFNTSMSIAISALVMGAFYIGLASGLWKRGPAGMRLLTESFLALGVVFASLAIPLALDGRWSSAAWALEGAALIWVGIRQQRVLPRLFGIILQAGAGSIFIAEYTSPVGSTPVINGIYLGSVLIALAGLFSSYYLSQHNDKLKFFEAPLSIILFVWGLLWWFGSGLNEIQAFVSVKYLVNASFAFIAASLLLGHVVEQRLKWHLMRLPVLGHVYVLVIYLLAGIILDVIFSDSHPFRYYGWLVWSGAIAMQYFLLYRYRTTVAEGVLKWQHIISFWLVTALLSWEAAYAIDKLVDGSHAWHDVMLIFVPALIMLVLLTFAKKIRWPFSTHYHWYISIAAVPVMLGLAFVAAGFAVFHEGNPWPLNYIPLLNPVDLAVGFIIYVLILWYLQLTALQSRLLTQIDPQTFKYALAVFAFAWLNGMLARTLHHWSGIDYTLPAMLASTLFQASVSVLWTVIALLVMTIGSRKANRHLWFIGLGLFSLVAAKLFLHDIANAGALAMAISITVIGILAVVFGYYLSPLPPKSPEQDKE